MNYNDFVCKRIFLWLVFIYFRKMLLNGIGILNNLNVLFFFRGKLFLEGLYFCNRGRVYIVWEVILFEYCLY